MANIALNKTETFHSKQRTVKSNKNGDWNPKNRETNLIFWCEKFFVFSNAAIKYLTSDWD